MAYPSFVTVVALLVVVLFLTVLLPQIEGHAERLGGEMTWSAQLLIDGSNWMLKLGPFLILGLIVLIFGLGQWKRTLNGKRMIDEWSLKIPLIGNIITIQTSIKRKFNCDTATKWHQHDRNLSTHGKND